MTGPLVAVALFIAVLVATALLVAAAVISLLAWAILHPPRMTDGKAAWVLKRLSPGDLGMKFEEVEFAVRDGRRGEPLRIRGWWIPSPDAHSDRCVVMVHGYADAKVGVIAWAPTWHAMGFHILAIDLRAHGESGGTLCTGGYFERDDLRQVIHQTRARYPKETVGGIALFGVSLGTLVAAAAAAASAPNTDVERPEILAVVLDSPIAGFREGIGRHVELLGVVGPWAVESALKLAERVSGANFGILKLTELLKTIEGPVLLIVGDRDPFVPPLTLDLLTTAMTARDDPRDAIEIVPGAGHLMPLTADPPAYAQAIQRFLSPETGGTGAGKAP